MLRRLISHVVFIGSHLGRKFKRQTRPPYKRESPLYTFRTVSYPTRRQYLSALLTNTEDEQ